MTSETIKLNLIPGGELPVLHASQFDDGRALSFIIYDGDEPYASYAAYNISLHLRKVDGTIIGIDTFTIDDVNDCVVFTTTEQMTACAGKNIGELVFTDPLSGVVVGSCNFILEVEPDPYAGGIDSASDIENLSTQIASIVDSQLNNYYTKEEIDDQIETIVTEQVTPIVSSIVAEQVPPAVQAELGNYYTKSETDSAFYDKSEVDTLLSGKADTSDLPDMDNYYDKTTTDTLLASKANTSTTYTKTEVDNLIAALPSNDITTEIDTPASVHTFADGGDNIPLKSLVTEIVPIQASGIPSPQNPLPITGFDTVDVVATGKNLWSEGNKTFTLNENIILDKPLTGEFTFSGIWSTNSGYNCLAIFFNENTEITRNLFSPDGQRHSFTYNFTTPLTSLIVYSGDNYVHSQNKVCTITDIQLEQGDTATTYVPFGTTHTIPLGSTIYGGSLECVEGKGQSTYKMLTENDFTSYQAGPTSGGLSYVITPTSTIKAKNKTNGISNMLPLSTSSWNSTTPCFELNAGQSPNIFAVRIVGSFTSLEDFKTQYAGLQICYEMVTPDDISISGANIPTLSGTNNIYTDCGDIQSLEYFNNKADDIAAMILLMTRS